MNKQDVFNRVWNGLKSQGFEQSTKDGYLLAYRGDNGKKCAIGWLIKDSNYSEALEGMYWPLAYAYAYGHVEWEMAPLLNHLQAAHDHCPNPKIMRNALISVAIRHNLEIPK